jgi:ubiquinone biosynthesis accessory factor UbiK
MIDDPKRPNLDELARQLAGAIPQNLRALSQDVERNFRSLLHSGLERMDLVTREEFDLQAAVLERTREKLEALETRLAELEKSADHQRDTGAPAD